MSYVACTYCTQICITLKNRNSSKGQSQEALEIEKLKGKTLKFHFRNGIWVWCEQNSDSRRTGK